MSEQQPFYVQDWGDEDAAYWVAEETGTGRVLARGYDRTKVGRDAHAKLMREQEDARNQAQQSES